MILPARHVLAGLHATLAAARLARGDAAGARRAALSAQRLNVTARVSVHKLELAVGSAQRQRPRDTAGRPHVLTRWL